MLRLHGHDVENAGDWHEDPGDVEILRIAFDEGRVLITIDKDFGELAVRQGQKHCGILRLVDFPGRQQAEACLKALEQCTDDLEKGAIVTAERGRIRIRYVEAVSESIAPPHRE